MDSNRCVGTVQFDYKKAIETAELEGWTRDWSLVGHEANRKDEPFSELVSVGVYRFSASECALYIVLWYEERKSSESFFFCLTNVPTES